MKKLIKLIIYLFLSCQQPVSNSPSDALSSGWQIPTNPVAIHQSPRSSQPFPWRSVQAKPLNHQLPLNPRDVDYDIDFNSPYKDKRQAKNGSEFIWRATKTPQFVTSLLQKQEAGPVVNIYPPDVVYRNGRSREMVLPQRNDHKRVIYYTTLSDGPRHTPNSNRRQHDISVNPLSLPLNHHRSYDPTKVGKDFVTRVQSSVIGILPPRDEGRKDISSTPSFTIIDAHPTSYPHQGMDRIMISDYHNAIGGVDKDRHLLPYGYSGVVDPTPYQYNPPVKLQHPNLIPYHGGVNKQQYQVSQYQYHHQPYPQLYTEVEKIGPLGHQLNQHTTFQTAAYYNVPSYPTRHNRFPPERYPTSSSLNFLDAPAPAARPPSPGLDHSLHHNSGLSHGLHQNAVFSHGHEPPTPTSSLHPESGFELNDNFAPHLGHTPPLGLDGHRPFRNKYSTNYGDFFAGTGQKYLDLGGNGLSNDFSYKPQFSQVSDWLTSSFDLEEFNSAAAAANAAATGDQDYHIKGDSSQMNGTNPYKEVNNTVITPFTSSFSNGTELEDT